MSSPKSGSHWCGLLPIDYDAAKQNTVNPTLMTLPTLSERLLGRSLIQKNVAAVSDQTLPNGLVVVSSCAPPLLVYQSVDLNMIHRTLTFLNRAYYQRRRLVGSCHPCPQGRSDRGEALRKSGRQY